MSMECIRRTYNVPAKRGQRVRYTPYGNRYLVCEGVIVGSKDGRLKIRMGEEKKVGVYHPTWELEYLKEDE